MKGLYSVFRIVALSDDWSNSPMTKLQQPLDPYGVISAQMSPSTPSVSLDAAGLQSMHANPFKLLKHRSLLEHTFNSVLCAEIEAYCICKILLAKTIALHP